MFSYFPAAESEQNVKAMDMILKKIVEDPQSGSCPNISYAEYKGPVASSNPTGSPFANNSIAGPQFNGNMGASVGNMSNSMNNLNLNASGGTGQGGQGGGGQGGNNPALENLKATLRGSGYAEQAVEEISAAMYTLANYGFLGLGLGLMNLNSGGLQNLAQAGFNNSGNQPQGQQGNLNLGILSTNAASGGPHSLLGNGSNTGSADTNPSVFGPVGSTTTTMAGGDTGEGSGTTYFSTAGTMGADRYGGGGDSMFGNAYNASGSYGASSFNGTNQNSFGLGTGMGTTGMGSFGPPSEDPSGATKKEMEVGERIVGAILGPGGKGIVELQKFSGANIQISKKGVYAPGTRNRIVTITGSSSSIQRAQYLIQQRITQEESKRARQATGQGPVPSAGP